ncbi:hypothetical protein QJS10_CPB19g00983 [Acorus calamus]|uniref:Apple domain-containing protein n=1 Tax=Acorus calamus TaxID=4465 RepID=A0AAV9CDF6_ACOCL|nr:hypothetical protein QJS10_CPB19g00983 [Acorus calamus]
MLGLSWHLRLYTSAPLSNSNLAVECADSTAIAGWTQVKSPSVSAKGYSFIDEDFKYKGCKPDFTAQRCDIDESKLYRFEEMLDTNWPDFNHEKYYPINEDECRSLCLEDHLCAVATFQSGNCWKKRLPLTNGMVKIGSGKALIKVSIGNLQLVLHLLFQNRIGDIRINKR